MKNLAFPLPIIGLILFLRGMFGVIIEYNDLTPEEGWSRLAMITIAFYGVVIFLIHLPLKLILKGRKELLVAESTIVVIGLIALISL
jgi:hypothetical protein